jgi:hypothetical protein
VSVGAGVGVGGIGLGVGGTGVDVGAAVVGVGVFSVWAASWGVLSSAGGGVLSACPPQPVKAHSKTADDNKNTNHFDLMRCIYHSIGNNYSPASPIRIDDFVETVITMMAMPAEESA